jgi:MarR family transcriptional regulator, organic hydroperoxide resistance regulator
MGIVTSVQRATHLIGRHLDSALAEIGVDQAEAHVLSALSDRAMSVGALVEVVGFRRSTLTNVLDRLERRGLVQREINPADRRSFVVRPTRGGERAARKVAVAFAAVDAQLERTASATDRKSFDAVLGKLEDLL